MSAPCLQTGATRLLHAWSTASGLRGRSATRTQPHPRDRDPTGVSCRKLRPFGRSDRFHRCLQAISGQWPAGAMIRMFQKDKIHQYSRRFLLHPCSIHLRVAADRQRRPCGPNPLPGYGDLQGSWTMKSLLLGATMLVGLLVASANPSFAAGDGLDRDAAAQGNGRFAGMHRGARITSRYGVMHPRRHHRHHRR